MSFVEAISQPTLSIGIDFMIRFMIILLGISTLSYFLYQAIQKKSDRIATIIIVFIMLVAVIFLLIEFIKRYNGS